MQRVGVGVRVALEQRAEDGQPLVRDRRAALAAGVGEALELMVDVGGVRELVRGHASLRMRWRVVLDEKDSYRRRYRLGGQGASALFAAARAASAKLAS